MKFPNKVYVLGGSGSGKSTLAKKISHITHHPHFELDDIMWAKKYTHKLPIPEREQKVHDILSSHSSWVIEGCFIDWADECYRQADLVILLDVSKYVVAWRILIRYFSRTLHGDFTETIGGVIGLIRWAMTYQNPQSLYSLRRHIEDCKKYNCKYIIIKRFSDLGV